MVQPIRDGSVTRGLSGAWTWRGAWTELASCKDVARRALEEVGWLVVAQNGQMLPRRQIVHYQIRCVVLRRVAVEVVAQELGVRP